MDQSVQAAIAASLASLWLLKAEQGLPAWQPCGQSWLAQKPEPLEWQI